MSILRNGVGGKYQLLHNGDLLKKAYHNGTEEIWSAGSIAVYHLMDGSVYQEEVTHGSSCLSPTTFNTDLNNGWYFVGWREDQVASDYVLPEKAMGDEAIHLYAVYAQDITLTYDGNGATGGSTESQTLTRYCNGANTSNPTFVLKNNGFTRTDYTFKSWAIEGIEFGVGEFIAMNADTTVHAVWLANPWTFAEYTKYQLTKISEAYATVVAVMATDSGYKVQVRDTETGVGGYGTVTARTGAIPTNGCNKVRVKYKASHFEGSTECGSINDVKIKPAKGDYLYFDCEDTFTLTMQAVDATAYYAAVVEVTELYFYSE